MAGDASIHTHHVAIEHVRDYELAATFTDVPAAEPLLFDEPEPLGHDRAPNAAAVLGAAVGDCLATSLAFCLDSGRRVRRPEIRAAISAGGAVPARLRTAIAVDTSSDMSTPMPLLAR